MRPTRSQIIAMVQGFAHEISEREFPPFGESQVISALGMDSLSTLEMVGMIERELSIRLPTEELTDVHTIGLLTDLIESKLG
jgi:acyl carrier protein